MRIVDVLMAFPFLILVVAIMSILGPGLSNLYIAVRRRRLDSVRAHRPAAKRWPRAIWNTCRPRARSAARRARIMLRHILPNVIAPGLVYVFTGMVLAILIGATLSFSAWGRSRRRPNGAP